jgi:putative inorganic carbon (hco3(-)) transporter
MIPSARPSGIAAPRLWLPLWLRRDNIAIGSLAALIALVAAVVTDKSPQAGVAFVLFVATVAAYVESRRMGLAMLWSIWLLAPLVRRVLALSSGTPAADPLSLLPFVLTAVLVLLELRRSAMNQEARTTMLVAGAGFLIGAPMGLLNDPTSLMYGLLSYVSGVAAIVIGWTDGRERTEGGDRAEPTLLTSLKWVMPLLAVYGILQYFLTLTSWDSNWIETVQLASIGSPQEGHIRIFSTLNSPGTFALVVAVALILGFGMKRGVLFAWASNILLIVALALTYVRSAWLALVVGLIVYAAAARGKSAKRLVLFIGVFVLLTVTVGSANPTTRAFTERITTFGHLGSDESAQTRLSLTDELPHLIGQPLGSGLGAAGQSKRLSEGAGGKEEGVATDNGYLAQLDELGPIGFLLVLFAMVRAATAGLRGVAVARGPNRPLAAAALATIMALLLAHAGGDILYGVTGVFFWYIAGLAMALANSPQRGRKGANAAGGSAAP